MRGRQPRVLVIKPKDMASLQQIATSQVRPWYQVQRAGILIAVASGERIAAIADYHHVDAATVWRIGRRFERYGILSVTTLLTRPKEDQTAKPTTTSLTGT